jgi:hypothetical protein
METIITDPIGPYTKRLLVYLNFGPSPDFPSSFYCSATIRHASLCLLRRFAYCVALLAVPHPQGSGDTLQKKCTLDIVDALRL